MIAPSADDASAIKRGEDASRTVKAIWGMVGRRQSTGTINDGLRGREGDVIPRGSDHPFVRKMGKSAFETPGGEGEGELVSATASAGRNYGVDTDGLDPCQKSTF